MTTWESSRDDSIFFVCFVFLLVWFGVLGEGGVYLGYLMHKTCVFFIFVAWLIVWSECIVYCVLCWWSFGRGGSHFLHRMGFSGDMV